MIQLSVVLPIYNEDKRLRLCLDRLLTYLYNYTNEPFEIIGVLNGCQDASGTIIHNFAALWPQIKILSLLEAGKGLAIKTGMLQAKGRYRMMMDVDLAMPPTEIPAFLEAIQEADIVIGRRSQLGTSMIRRAAHETFKVLSRPITKVQDPQSGFKMFTGKCADDVFKFVSIPGYSFDLEVLYLADLLGYKVKEIPVRYLHGPDSKINVLRDGIQMAKDLVRIKQLHTM